MSVLPLKQDLLIKWMQQGMEKGYIQQYERSLNGEAYLSSSFIHNTSISAMLKQQGRTTVMSLAEQVNMDVATFKPYLTPLLTSQHWTLIDDFVLSSDYLTTLKTQCLHCLKEQGYLSLVAQAQQSSLPYRLFQSILRETEDTKQYSELSDIVFTRDYVDQQHQRIIDHLLAATEPTSMQNLQKMLGLQEGVFYFFLDQIVKDNHHSLKGTWRGRRERAVFLPHIYRDTQMAMIDSLLKAGNYIEYSTVEQHYAFATPKDLLLKLHPDIILLESCAVTDHIISSFENTLLCSNITCFDSSTHFPSTMSSPDMATLLEMAVSRSNKNNKSSLVLLGRFITTQQYMEHFMDKLQPYLNQKAIEITKQQKKGLHGSSTKARRKKDMDINLTNEEVQAHLVDQFGLDPDFALLLTVKLKRSIKEALQHSMQSVYILPSSLENDFNGNNSDPSWMGRQSRHLDGLIQDLREKLFYNIKAVALFKDEAAKKTMEKYMIRQPCLDLMFYLVLAIAFWQSKDSTEMTTITGLRLTDIEHPDQVVETQKRQVIAALVSSETEYQADLAPLQQALQTGKKPDAFRLFLLKDSSSSSLVNKLKWENLESESNQRQANDHFRNTIHHQLKSTSVSESSAPLILHLTSLVCFQHLHHLPLNVSGKCVPSILKHLSPLLLLHSSDNTESTMHPMLHTSGKHIADQLERAQAMIIASRKSNTDQTSSPASASASSPQNIDLGLIQQIYQLGLDLCTFSTSP